MTGVCRSIRLADVIEQNTDLVYRHLIEFAVIVCAIPIGGGIGILKNLDILRGVSGGGRLDLKAEGMAIQEFAQLHIETAEGRRLTAVGHIDQDRGNHIAAVCHQIVKLIGLTPEIGVGLIVHQILRFLCNIAVGAVQDEAAGQAGIGVVANLELFAGQSDLFHISSRKGSRRANANKQSDDHNRRQELREFLHM